jgi:hypothetical protein
MVGSFSAVSEAKLITVELAVFSARSFDNARFRLIARILSVQHQYDIKIDVNVKYLNQEKKELFG